MLEVGFRDSFNLIYLDNLGLKVSGIEVNKESIKIANNIGIKNVFAEDIQKKTHFSEFSFDIISMRDVLEHCYSPLKALEEVRRILKDNGRVVVSIPMEEEFDNNLLHGHSCLFYNKEYFYSFAGKAGFKVVKEDTRNRGECHFLLVKNLSIENYNGSFSTTI